MGAMITRPRIITTHTESGVMLSIQSRPPHGPVGHIPMTPQETLDLADALVKATNGHMTYLDLAASIEDMFSDDESD